MSGWISVNDRLPEDGIHVLTYCPQEKEVKVNYLVILGLDEHEKTIAPFWACTYEDDIISHWMPLPEPPAEFIKRNMF